MKRSRSDNSLNEMRAFVGLPSLEEVKQSKFSKWRDLVRDKTDSATNIATDSEVELVVLRKLLARDKENKELRNVISSLEEVSGEATKLVKSLRALRNKVDVWAKKE